MREIISKPILAILLNDKFREAGSSEINGKLVKWDSGYVLTVLPYGEKRGEAVRKYTVCTSAESAVSSLLSTVGWGSLIELHLDGNKVVNASLLVDWSTEIPID